MPSAQLTAAATLRKSIQDCTLCPLSDIRQHAVPWTGSNPLALVFSNPGQASDTAGAPILPDSIKPILLGLGITQAEVTLVYVNACHSGLRLPEKAEVAACSHWLTAQLGMAGARFLGFLSDVPGWTDEVPNGTPFTKDSGHTTIMRIRDEYQAEDIGLLAYLADRDTK